MYTDMEADQKIDLGDAVIETKGTQRGAPDELAGEKFGMGLVAED